MSTTADRASSETGTGRSPEQRPRRRWRVPSGFWWRAGLVLEVVVILAIWEVAIGRFELIRASFLPPPSAIWRSLVELVSDPDFIDTIFFSLQNLAIGLVLASAVGIVLGFLVGWFRILHYTVAPFLWLLYSTPKVALGPIIILALGLGSASKIALVFLLAVFPILLNTIDGVETVSGSLVRAGRVFGFNGWALGRKVIVPATFPFLLVGLQRGIALGFIGEILGEFLGGAGGLGHDLEQATFDFRMDDALAIVVVMVIVANAGLLLVSLLRKRFAPWYETGVARLW